MSSTGRSCGTWGPSTTSVKLYGCSDGRRETASIPFGDVGLRHHVVHSFCSRDPVDEGYLLNSPRTLPDSPTSDNNFLSQLTYDITARLRDTPVYPRRVWHALEAATFYEWGSFVRSNPPETFHAASQNTKKAGARNSLYARVCSHFPNPVHPSLTRSFSTRYWMPANPFHTHPRRTTDASNRSYRSLSPKGTRTFACTKEQHWFSRCFAHAFSQEVTHDWTASISTFIQKRTKKLSTSPTSRVSTASSAASRTDPIHGLSLTVATGSLAWRT